MEGQRTLSSINSSCLCEVPFHSELAVRRHVSLSNIPLEKSGPSVCPTDHLYKALAPLPEKRKGTHSDLDKEEKVRTPERSLYIYLCFQALFLAITGRKDSRKIKVRKKKKL